MLVVLPSALVAQIGGQRSFEFQNVPATTRLTALGGVNVSLPEEDLNLVFANPALSGDTLSGYASFNYLAYFADVNVATFAYQHDLGKYGNWFIGATHFGYGSFTGRDATGAETEEFESGETLLILGRSHKVGNFTIGASLKFINSSLAEYTANALAVDLGGVFKHPEKQLNVGLVFKNIGVVLGDYTSSSDSKLPFDVQLGTSFKPEFMPFRFSFTAYNLYQGDISYFNENAIEQEEEPGNADKVLRHLTVGAELLLSKNVNLRVGYNHLVRQELKLEETAGGAGLSFGLMFRVKAFEFSYSRGGYHAAGGSHNFGLAANTNSFFKKK
ncbi:type IX secretion system protein PorQ [Fulvivirga sp. RKSG066]|nr:type IX secretion system protein PorQ [Fulvivirga aurantia]MTI21480.1 type IX secretion system protein PorQ [Fulvivirga aurantia]